MTRSVAELVVILVGASIVSVASLFVSAVLLSAARTDLKAIYQAGIGNGRRAAARGEHRLAWARFIEAGATTVMTTLLVVIGATASSPTVGLRWVAIVVLVALIDCIILYKCIVATRTRSRIYDLAAHGDLSVGNGSNGR